MNEKRTLENTTIESLWKIKERHNELNDRRIDSLDSLDFWSGLSEEEIVQMHQDRFLLLTLAETLTGEIKESDAV
jgi:hypothetical protein